MPRQTSGAAVSDRGGARRGAGWTGSRPPAPPPRGAACRRRRSSLEGLRGEVAPEGAQRGFGGLEGPDGNARAERSRDVVPQGKEGLSQANRGDLSQLVQGLSLGTAVGAVHVDEDLGCEVWIEAAGSLDVVVRLSETRDGEVVGE